MPVLPLPLIASVILIYLLLRAVLRRESSVVMLALLAICTVQGAVISANLHYGLAWASRVQPITAAIIPAQAWLGFVATTRRPLTVARDGWHAVGPLCVSFCTLFAPAVLDQAVMLVFVVYGVALMMALRTGRDGLEQTSLQSGDTPLLIWRGIAGALLASGLSDLLIVGAMMAGQPGLRLPIVALFSTASLLALGALGLSQSLGAAAEPLATDPAPTLDDAAIMIEVEQLMTTGAPYLDPDLTLAQIARRLRRPAKAVSAAINRSRGENVSRYINAHRIARSGDLLRDGQSVTQAMLASGFNTKSNFNRAFLLVRGVAPTDWLAAQDGVDKSTQSSR